MSKTDLRLCALGSGSKGNSIYIEGGGARVLVDAGLCGKELTSRLEAVGASPGDIDAILVTHNHRDHISGVGVMARRYNIPVYCAYKTIKAAERVWGKIEDINEIEAGNLFTVNGLELYPFSTPHDSAHSVGFIFKAGEKKGGIATDLGFVTRLVRESLKNCNILVLESNHDEKMLIDGPYPWHLKQRIRGREGHLSNGDCADLLDDIYHDGLQKVVLAHLSEENNRPDLAYDSILKKMGGRFHPELELSIAKQDRVGDMVEV
ncbi:MAG: MBL fold metallo-hydrolase [bacterium]|nr:MBL fold metallo-hydrolase [bacterium]